MKRSHGFLLIILVGFWLLFLVFFPSVRFGINRFFAALPFVGFYFERFTEQYIDVWFENPGIISFLPSLILTLIFILLWVFNSLYSFSSKAARWYRRRIIHRQTTKHLSKNYFDDTKKDK